MFYAISVDISDIEKN